MYRNGRSMSDVVSEEYMTIDDGSDADLPYPTLEIHIGGAGDLEVTRLDGERVTLRGLGEGRYAMAATNVWASGTTATDITVFF